ncbi:MAG: hypothetical protein AAGG44_13590, partial [Planctomycetota bacterium]
MKSLKVFVYAMIAALLTTAQSRECCHANYKDMLARGTDRDKLRELYDCYESVVLADPEEPHSELLKKLAG